MTLQQHACVRGRADNLTALFHRSADGDAQARETIILRYLPLARGLARRYDRRGESLEDLCQVATVGLIRAVDRYAPDRGASFAAFARPTILGELRRHFRDHTWRVHVPRAVRDEATRVAGADMALLASGARPREGAVATSLGLEPAAVLEARLAWAAHRPESLDAPYVSADGERLVRRDVVAGDGAEFERAEMSIGIARALEDLRPSDRIVVLLRLGGELTQSEIAARVGVSQMHVSRILRRANPTVADACGLTIAA